MLFLLKKLVIFYTKTIHLFDKTDVFNNEFYNVNQALKRNYKNIVKEFTNFNGDISNFEDLSNVAGKIVNKNHWKSIWLKCFGIEINETIKHFPITYNTLLPFKNVTSIMFSVVKPGTIIQPHTGPFSGVLRYQHGLIIPKSKKVFIEINSKKYFWKENESIIFDDTFIHSVQNLSNSNRVILFLDIIRPLPFPLNTINKVLLKLISISPLVNEVVDNSKLFFEQQNVKKQKSI